MHFWFHSVHPDAIWIYVRSVSFVFNSVRSAQSGRVMTKTVYDAVVIGAGPAGSRAAFEIASAGFSVLLLEKDSRPGVPLCCAEGVFGPSIKNILDLDDKWISQKIDRAEVVAPDGERVSVFFQDAGFILDRTVFDYDLAMKAVNAGVRLECNVVGQNPQGDDGRFDSLEVLYPDGSTVRVETGIIIAADGVESQIARQAGMDNRLDLSKVAAALEYRLENIKLEENKVSFYVGQNIAPGGYIWVFPKSGNSANVGLTISLDGRDGATSAGYLDRFINGYFPDGEIVKKHCGLLPSYMGKAMFRIGNILIVGDAARALDSLSGAGIVNAVLSGKYAGQAAVEFLSGRVVNFEEIDEIYPGRFLDEKGADLSNYLRLRRAYEHFNDKDFSSVIKVLRKYFETHSAYDVHVAGLFINIIKTTPRLLRLVRYLI